MSPLFSLRDHLKKGFQVCSGQRPLEEGVRTGKIGSSRFFALVLIGVERQIRRILTARHVEVLVAGKVR